MGFYINPKEDGLSKEAWLSIHGKRITVLEVEDFDYTKSFPVCLVDNYSFTAAGICYDAGETEAFLMPDGRSKVCYSVPRDALREFCHLA